MRFKAMAVAAVTVISSLASMQAHAAAPDVVQTQEGPLNVRALEVQLTQQMGWHISIFKIYELPRYMETRLDELLHGDKVDQYRLTLEVAQEGFASCTLIQHKLENKLEVSDCQSGQSLREKGMYVRFPELVDYEAVGLPAKTVIRPSDYIPHGKIHMQIKIGE